MAVIAIDVDDTIFRDEYPDVGSLLPHAKRVINWLYSQGHTIIICTCREGIYADRAIKALRKHNINYHRFNTNDPIRSAKYGYDSRKIGCDILIDDRCILAKEKGIDWLEIESVFKRILAKSPKKPTFV